MPPRMFAITSLSENFGLAAFEAMRRGVPVLATPNVGMSEIVRESGAGRVVDATPAAIAAGIAAMLGDPAGQLAPWARQAAPTSSHTMGGGPSPAAWPISTSRSRRGGTGALRGHDGLAD